jgi:hypothetical protein
MLDPLVSQAAHQAAHAVGVGPGAPSPAATAALAPPPPSDEIALSWLVFVGLLAVALVFIPLAAALVRRALPAELRMRIPVEPVAFGHSPRAQRSPRHPVRTHRTLLATALLVLPALIVLLGVGLLRRDGLAAVEGALALCLPILLVTLHARRRSASS